MKNALSRGEGAECQFDRFCKLVLQNEARDYVREVKRRREREVSFSCLSQNEQGKLLVWDQYPSDSITFSSHGCDLQISNELVAEAFSALPQCEQSILILRSVLVLSDREIGSLLGLSRSAVQRRRTKIIHKLRNELVVQIEGDIDN